MLSTQKKYRKETKTFLVFGSKLIQELSEVFTPIKVVTNKNFPETGDIVFSDSLFKQISNQPTPEGIFAEFPLPVETPITEPLLILDGIQDPGNMGTLLRSALAFGWGSIIFLPGCVDPFSPKVVQASRAGIMHLSFRFFTAHELSVYLKENSLPLYIADCNGTRVDQVTPQNKCALMLGNEGQGITTQIEGSKITIPTHPNTESLNVAVAGSIIMHHLKPYE